ncbi:alpha/beta fold hydrolase [Kitasatospora kifunensis]|uniref:Pimeloyl-ACP methyl ester carboxylesterase n=1 Tax=Kitasatospora kifunensis TaxID=58351 RepID=A0A7W7RC06_KITKI|nr:alpha/beta hydrolase [Kitasatospora kifunensis]MBB4928616.1 pimeloyl-ACP methyl ester carboxylesterase [Kitasatospora kifunensis]
MTTPPKGAYASVNGLEMYYEIHGTGRPLVLLHGGVHTIGLTFGAIMPALAATHRVIAVELQGHGHTADIDREMSVPGFAEDVVALLDVLGIERADLFGFSLGGMTALEMALRYPARADRVVLASVPFQPDGYLEEIRDPALHAGSRRLPTAADFQAMVDAYTAVAPHPEHFQDFMARCTVAAGYEGWSEDDLRGLVPPALLVVGDTDFVRIEHAAQMHRLIPDARLAILPDCLHMDVMRRTELLLPMVESFLAP